MYSESERRSLIDAELLKKIGETDDSRALEAVMKYYHPKLQGIVHGILGNSMDEDDALQETQIKVWECTKNGSYKEKGQFKSWLFKVARSIALDMLEKRTLHRSSDILTNGEETMAGTEKNPEEQLLTRYEMQRFLGALSPAFRRVVEKRMIEDKSEAAAAAELGIKAGTVRSMLSRAMEIMRAMAYGVPKKEQKKQKKIFYKGI